MKHFAMAIIALATVILASCSQQANLPTSSVAEETKMNQSDQTKGSESILTIESGKWGMHLTVPSNQCGVPTDCIWFNCGQRDVSWNSNHTQETVIYQATGYSYDCSEGNSTGSYSFDNTPASTGRSYQIVCKSVFTYPGKNQASIGWPTKIEVYNTVKLLPNGPTVSWKDTWVAGKGSTISNVKCK